MKLAYIDLCGFRGYRKHLRIDFSEDFTIIDGRNGVGKSTIFDAVEFALTGRLSKYNGTKADGETVADYVWWKGSGLAPEDHYVEAGFRDDDGIVSIRRTAFDSPDNATFDEFTARLCDLDLAPSNPIPQLCTTSIIRDEHIAGMSLDLKETERYTLLRDGLGANDSDSWITRGAQLVSATKKRSQAAQKEVESFSSELMAASRRVDEVRSNLVDDNVLADSVNRLRVFSKSEAVPDQLHGPVRMQIARVGEDIQFLQDLLSKWKDMEEARGSLSDLNGILKSAMNDIETSAKVAERLQSNQESSSSSELAKQAHDLIDLAKLGRQLGLQDGHCPLCGSGQDHAHYQRGIATAENLAKSLDRQAVEEAQNEQEVQAAERRLADARKSFAVAEDNFNLARQTIQEFDALRNAKGLSDSETPEQLRARVGQLREGLGLAERDLRVLDTIRLNAELERSKQEELRAKDRLTSAQEGAGRARKAETAAQALHDAARRASGEMLDGRLDRVLPLMSELYRRLRPHPVWRNIEYSIRGDVRKFLKLKVGDDLNPQFLFSSGQRRATGLAFLLSVNLSLAWSRWRTIMLDDPVQHVDDFRTVHLAELVAQFVSDGRQIVCAVEDAALAELLCRRLPIRALGAAKRITMGTNENGDLAVISEKTLSMLPKQAFLAGRVA